jgi:hypothetical protein
VVIRGRHARAVRVNRICEPNLKLQAQYAEKATLLTEAYPALAASNRKL